MLRHPILGSKWQVQKRGEVYLNPELTFTLRHIICQFRLRKLRKRPKCLTLFDPIDCSPNRLLRQWEFPGKNTGVDCHSLLQGIFPTSGSNWGLLHCRRILYHLSQGSPKVPWSHINKKCLQIFPSPKQLPAKNRSKWARLEETWLYGKWTFKRKLKPPSFRWGTIRWHVWALLTVARFHKLIWESQQSSWKHFPLQFSPSCSSWGCSLMWSKLVKKLKFSSFTLLGQSFCRVPAHGFCYTGQMLRASWASLMGSSVASPQDSMCVRGRQQEVVQRGCQLLLSLVCSTESGLCNSFRGTEVIGIHF